MDFDFSGEQYTMRDEARRFLGEQCPMPVVRAAIEGDRGPADALWRQIADLGWPGIPFAEADGGLGQTFLDCALIVEELGRAAAPVPFLSSVCMAGMAIAAHGSPEQRARLLPAIASGDRIAALAVAETGFDPASVGTTARGSGAGVTVSGRKRAVLDAGGADLLVVVAVGERGPGFYVVESGFAVEPRRAYDPTRTIGDVALDTVAAEPLDAVPGVTAGLTFATAALCAEMTGVAARILDMSVAYAKDRVQFGRPIGSFQAIKHKAAEMLTDLEAARAGVAYAFWAASTGAPDAAQAASVAKSFCSESLARLAGEGVQMHGGIAFTWEHDMHIFLRRMKSDEALLGDAAYHRERIAQLIGL